MKIYTTAIKGLDGINRPFPCQFVRLRNGRQNMRGEPWTPAEIFHGLGSPATIVVDAATLFIDRACRVRVFARNV